MRSFLRHLAKLDWILATSAASLTLIGILSIAYSSPDGTLAGKQSVFLLAGITLMVALSFLNWRMLRNAPVLLLALYAAGVLALGGLLIFAPVIRGIRGWYQIGGISVDPIEFMKIVLILLMARFFSWRHAEMHRVWHVVLSGLYFAVPVLLVFLQPDLGAAAILVFLWALLLLVAGIKFRHLAILGIAASLVGAFGWSVMLKDYQQERVISFLQPELDPLGMGWSQRQAEIAVGSGGLLGKGIGEGTQTQYGFLSEPETDFMFAALAEEVGFAGVLAVFLLYGVLLWRVLRIGWSAASNFPRLFATGFAGLLLVQFAVNIGMNLGMLPIVGLPLPLVSYGGSSLVMTYAGLGILQSMHYRG